MSARLLLIATYIEIIYVFRERVLDDYTEQYINAGVGISKN